MTWQNFDPAQELLIFTEIDPTSDEDFLWKGMEKLAGERSIVFPCKSECHRCEYRVEIWSKFLDDWVNI